MIGGCSASLMGNVHGIHLAEPEEDHCCITAAAQETPAPPEMAHGDDRLAGFSRELFRFHAVFMGAGSHFR